VSTHVSEVTREEALDLGSATRGTNSVESASLTLWADKLEVILEGLAASGRTATERGAA
jgi:hypothetical protein